MGIIQFALDAMSGEFGPEPMVQGAIDALQEIDLGIKLVGDPETLEVILEKHTYPKNRLEIEPASEIIEMSDQPVQAVKKKRDASVVVCAKLVSEGKVAGYFSAGNTGATLASSIQILGRLRGVKRPALVVPLPKINGTVTILIDGGANVDCKADWLIQFAIMGEIYAREIFNIINPRIGLLSNGEEDKKGNEQIQEAYPKFMRLPFDFVGNIEGRDLFGAGRKVDIAVCDGFIGNIVLKTAEGLVSAMKQNLSDEIKKKSLAKAGALLLRKIFNDFKRKMDYAEYGGVPLLGVNGTVIIGHGASNARAVKNAIKTGYRAIRNDINEHISENIHRYS